MTTTTDRTTTTHRATTSRLPPGQRRLEGFPRFGTHLSDPPPDVPDDPVITIRGAGIDALALPVADLGDRTRRRVEADFHCVSGWTATDLRWDGVAFADLYREVIVPALTPGTTITHVTFVGLDGVRAVFQLADALGDDVLVADRLDGEPLDGDHGAPVRVVSPTQYGYMSVKHLCRIDLHASEPDTSPRSLTDRLLRSHPRARVWEEERHGTLPGWLIRPVYRAVKTLLLKKMQPRRPSVSDPECRQTGRRARG